jgi:hypothetical protein
MMIMTARYRDNFASTCSQSMPHSQSAHHAVMASSIMPDWSTHVHGLLPSCKLSHESACHSLHNALCLPESLS